MSRGPPDISGMTSLKVDCDCGMDGELPAKWNAEELRHLFEKYGDVGDVFIPREKFGTRNRGFGFVRYPSEDDAEAAIKGMHGYELTDEATLKVTRATRSREEARAEGGGGGDGRGSGGRGRDYSPRGRSRSRSRSGDRRGGRCRRSPSRYQRYSSSSQSRDRRRRRR
uniref:RRM domain-containing protein n=1 Tax=Pyrodinium bahamense TaxID=73915 RepID=A0A7S0AG64_9DINO|mmetsp:Transcript_33866/g.93661  ORF Transcript_33866/g.93661 Transcript_33866/m.93661 type:complete len:168 (+) Transcript_33866:68-571(+)